MNAKDDYTNDIFRKTQIVKSDDLEMLRKKLSKYPVGSTPG